MSPDVRRAAEELAADVRAVFESRLLAVLIYGRHAGEAGGEASDDEPVHTLVLVNTLAMSDLEACARRRAHWRRRGLATPLLVDRLEFARSLDAFPIEFGAILGRHETVVGADPFEGLDVRSGDLRRACEVQARAHLLHLREGYLEAGGEPAAIAALVAASAPPLAALLTSIARLTGEHDASAARLAALAGRAAGHAGMFADVLGLAVPGVPTADTARMFPEYLEGMEALVAWVDRWDASA